MEYKEMKYDLFKVNTEYSITNPYALAHCISADLAMAGGIAVEFNRYFNMRNRLVAKYGDMSNEFSQSSNGGGMMLPEKVRQDQSEPFYVFNLVTKQYVYHRPTYASLEACLTNMRDTMGVLNLKRLAMPKIGCGIDGLDWDVVRDIINSVFKGTDISIIICLI